MMPIPTLVCFPAAGDWEICIAAPPNSITPWLHVGWVNECHIPHFAKRMIRAVNSYDVLVEALEAGCIDGRLQTFEDRERWRSQARDALDIAKKETKPCS